jgi:hypothetical protein
LKEIVLLSDDNFDSTVLKSIKHSPNYNIKKTKNPEEIPKILQKLKPDFILFSGKIKINAEGKYYLEI